MFQSSFKKYIHNRSSVFGSLELKWDFLITFCLVFICPSVHLTVNIVHFGLLFHNHCVEASLGCVDWSFFKSWSMEVWGRGWGVQILRRKNPYMYYIFKTPMLFITYWQASRHIVDFLLFRLWPTDNSSAPQRML